MLQHGNTRRMTRASSDHEPWCGSVRNVVSRNPLAGSVANICATGPPVHDASIARRALRTRIAPAPRSTCDVTSSPIRPYPPEQGTTSCMIVMRRSVVPTFHARWPFPSAAERKRKIPRDIRKTQC